MTDTPSAAPQAQRTIDLDPVAGYYKRLAEHHANEALMLAAQLREAMALLRQAQVGVTTQTDNKKAK